jgi:hypothetical protein
MSVDRLGQGRFDHLRRSFEGTIANHNEVHYLSADRAAEVLGRAGISVDPLQNAFRNAFPNAEGRFATENFQLYIARLLCRTTPIDNGYSLANIEGGDHAGKVLEGYVNHFKRWKELTGKRWKELTGLRSWEKRLNGDILPYIAAQQLDATLGRPRTGMVGTRVDVYEVQGREYVHVVGSTLILGGLEEKVRYDDPKTGTVDAVLTGSLFKV